MVSVGLIRRSGCFLLTQILVNTMSRNIHGLFWKLPGDLAKDNYFIRSHNDSRKLFANASKGSCFFILLIMVPKHVDVHCLKSVRIRSFSGPYSVLMLENTDQKNSEYGHFSCSDWLIV